ncbi:hypothetical protein FQU85_00640 (plasmid) [Salarchaeum sp. JOR-1]|nr:hypothetical protein FQU85_00640 [Salarchaeum sp. JOR-1]
MLLVAVLLTAAAVSGLLVALATAVYVRRRQRSYLLIVLAFTALFARAIVALLAASNTIPTAFHHVLEHGLDVVMACLVVAAVYYARTVERANTQ